MRLDADFRDKRLRANYYSDVKWSEFMDILVKSNIIKGLVVSDIS